MKSKHPFLTFLALAGGLGFVLTCVIAWAAWWTLQSATPLSTVAKDLRKRNRNALFCQRPQSKAWSAGRAENESGFPCYRLAPFAGGSWNWAAMNILPDRALAAESR